MTPLPRGVVTLLLADVEGSTQMWQRDSSEARRAMEELDELTDELVAKFDGARPLEQGEGDSFVAGFALPTDAVACALELQRRLTDGPLRVRMAVHTGEIEVRDGERYDGPVIIRTARIRDLAHGGQVLVSSATRDLVQDSLPDGADVIDLGPHALKNLDRPERVYQLVHQSLPNAFPPLRASETAMGNVPIQLTSFVGRTAEIDEVLDVLAGNRLVTLTGAGGCGKTRLAIEVASRVADRYRDGVWFVDLGPIADPDVVAAELCSVVGVRSQHRTDTDAVCAHLAAERALVLLDNCEHLIEASAHLVDALLRRCPDVTVLTTSREPLGVSGEVSWRVPSLAAPARGEVITADVAPTFDAVRLFVQCAIQVRPNFVIKPDNAAAIGEICARLEGIPLAIELAAARTRTLSVAQIASGLNDRFRLLGRGARTVLPRQQTLEASVGWSYDLLSEQQRMTLRRLAVFAGGFSLEAVEHVAAGDGIEGAEVLELISQLVDRSLVVADESGDEIRYWLLETIRQFSRERLVEAGEAPDVARRHLAWFRRFVRGTVGLLVSGAIDGGAASDRIDGEYDNIRTGVEWALADGTLREGLRLAAPLAFVWGVRTPAPRTREGCRWLRALLDEPSDAGARERAEGLIALASSSGFIFDWETTLRCATDGVAIAKEHGYEDLLRFGNLYIGQSLSVLGSDEATPYLEEAIATARSTGDAGSLALLLSSFAMERYYRSDLAGCIDAANEVMAAGAGQGTSARSWAAMAISLQGDLDGGLAELEELAAGYELEGNIYWASVALDFLGYMRYLRGDRPEGLRLIERSIGFASDGGFDHLIFAERMRAVFIRFMDGRFDDAVRELAGMPEKPGHLPGSMGEFMAAQLEILRALVHLGRGEVSEARGIADRVSAPASFVNSGLWSLTFLRAVVGRAAGEISYAEGNACDQLDLIVRSGAMLWAPDALDLAAALRGDIGADTDAVRLFAAAEAGRELIGIVRPNGFPIDVVTEIDGLRERIGSEAFDEAWSEGSVVPLADAIAFALRGRGPRQRPQAGWDALTPTELKVVALVTEGLSNPQIAERLFISKRTVSTHLSHVFAKVGVASRAELAAEATKRAV